MNCLATLAVILCASTAYAAIECLRKKDVLFILSATKNTVRGEEWENMIDFVIGIFDHFGRVGPNGVQVALIISSNSFDKQVEIYFDDFNTEADLRDYMVNNVTDMCCGDFNPVYDPIRDGVPLVFDRSRGDRPNVENLIFFLTDAKTSILSADDINAILRNYSPLVFSLGVGNLFDDSKLLAFTPPGNVFGSNYYDTLGSMVGPVINRACCKLKMDLLFMLDASGSISTREWKIILDFVKTLTNDLGQLGPDALQVSVIKFSARRETKVFIKFNDYYDKGQFFAALDALEKVRGQHSYIYDMLNSKMRKAFKNGFGARNDAKRMGIILSDGHETEVGASAENSLQAALDASAQLGIDIYAVGIGTGFSNEGLTKICNGDPARVFQVQNYMDLRKLLPPSPDEGHCVEPPCELEADIVFVLDSSGTINLKEFEQIKTFCLVMIDLIGPQNIGKRKIRIGAILYASKRTKEQVIAFELDQYQTARGVRDALDRLQKIVKNGATATYHALLKSLRVFTNKHRKKIAILLTDGEATDPRVKPKALRKLKKRGILLFAVGIGAANFAELLSLTYGDTGRVFNADGASALTNIALQLARRQCGEMCSLKADLLILLDTSRERSYSQERKFCSELVKRLGSVGPNDLQVSVFVYAFDSTMAFKLDKYRRKRPILEAIDNFSPRNGVRNTFGSIISATDVGFRSSNGARSNVPHILVLVTDGPPDDGSRESETVQALQNGGIIFLGVGIGTQQTLPSLGRISTTVTYFPTLSVMVQDSEKVMEAICEPICGKRLDVIFLLDSSGSIGDSKFAKMTQFVYDAVSSWDSIGPNGIQVGVILFGDRDDGKIPIYLGSISNKAALLNRIMDLARLCCRMTTHTYHGLANMTYPHFQTYGRGESVPQLTILMTDGRSKDRRRPEKKIAMKMINRGDLFVIVVGIGRTIDQRELLKIGKDESRVFGVNDYDSLSEDVHEIAAAVCNVNTS